MNGETQNLKSSNRFDLEQDILECWKVVSDINMLIDQDANGAEFAVLAQYYEHKFNRLWNTFEGMMRQRQLA